MRIDCRIKLGILLFGISLLCGCSSCGDTARGNENSENSNAVNVITPKEAPNSSAMVDNSNSKLLPYPGSENGGNPTLDESKIKVVDLSKAKPEPMPARKMPDNSEISTVQSPDGMSFIETRKFIDHPQIKKLERITKSGNDKTVKVFLQNEKVISIANNKLKDFSTDTASSILLVAGVKPITPASLKPDSKEGKMNIKPGAN